MAQRQTQLRVHDLAYAAGGWERESSSGQDVFKRGNRVVVVSYRANGGIERAQLQHHQDGPRRSWTRTRIAAVGPRDRDKIVTIADWFVGITEENS